MTFSFKSLQTYYNGYHFRSRTEARWALFFDTLDIPYEYEKEGYEMGGLRYLPDFWLPTLHIWIEIKGQEPTAEELLKAKRLFQGTGYPVCILPGNPGDNFGIAYYANVNMSGGGIGAPIDDLEWIECATCGNIEVNLRRRDDDTIVNMEEGWKGLNVCTCDIVTHSYNTPRLLAAYTAARQARFESRRKRARR